MKGWWVSSRGSQRMRRRRNQRGSAIAPSTTQRCTPRPQPCSVPRRAMCGVILEPADLIAVGLVVVAAVGVEVPGTLQWLAALAADRRDGFDQRDQPGDIVAVATGQRHGQRDPCASTIRWCLLPVSPRSTGGGPATATGSRCRARTGSRTAPCEDPAAYGRDAGACAAQPGVAARCAPTIRRRSPMVWRHSSSSRLARTPFGHYQSELTCCHSRQPGSLVLGGVPSSSAAVRDAW